MGAKRERFSRLESEVDVLCEDGSEAGSEDFRAKSMYVLVKDGSEAGSQDFRAKLT
jgi:hypothetical protein